jgi:hypothetical protein
MEEKRLRIDVNILAINTFGKQEKNSQVELAFSFTKKMLKQ